MVPPANPASLLHAPEEGSIGAGGPSAEASSCRPQAPGKEAVPAVLPMAWSEVVRTLRKRLGLPWETWQRLASSEGWDQDWGQNLQHAERIVAEVERPLGMNQIDMEVLLRIKSLDVPGVIRGLTAWLNQGRRDEGTASSWLRAALTIRPQEAHQTWGLAQEAIVGALLAAGARPIRDDWPWTLGVVWHAQQKWAVNERLFDRLAEVADPPADVKGLPLLSWWTDSAVEPQPWHAQGEAPSRLEQRLDRLWAAAMWPDEPPDANVKRHQWLAHRWLDETVRTVDEARDARQRCAAAHLARLGVSWEAATETGRRPQHIAAYRGNVAMLQWLAERADSLKAFDSDDTDPRHAGGILHQLGYGWADHFGADEHPVHMVRALTWWHDQVENWHREDAEGNTVLHGLAERGALFPTLWLLQAGAQVDRKNHRGETPLDKIHSTMATISQEDWRLESFEVVKTVLERYELQVRPSIAIASPAERTRL